MNTINDSDIVREQYKNASNLNTRISIHSKYSINKMGFGNWIVSNYSIKEGMRILELGCGTGDMWREHTTLLDHISEIVLSDFSEGMLNSAKEMLGENEHISYKVVDIQNIPFEDDSFDIVIANMMLYHVPEIDKGLAEVQRVLKKDGTFYCATYGENGIVEYISSLLKSYNVEGKLNKNFTLQNGKGILSNHFQNVIRYDYEDALEVTDIDDMIDYIYSLSSMSNIGNIERVDLKQILENNMDDGVLHVPKEYGMFICKAPGDVKDMRDTRLEQIRKSERNSHIEIYSTMELYESGSWLQKPIKTVLDIIPLFKGYHELHILDLGGGVGRNCIPFAQAYPNIPCTIECVDILELAIEKLKYNAEKFGVASSVKGIAEPIEEYLIAENSYDFIMAVSALEHVNSRESFIHKLQEIQAGIREKGIVCLVINSNVVEKDKVTGEALPPQFEVNLPTEELQALLQQIFAGWETIKETVIMQKYDIPREKGVAALTSHVVTLVARK